jgi:type II secretory pathway pseudopilin PulG
MPLTLKPRRSAGPKGVTLLEVTLALTILVGATALLAQFLVASSRQRRVADQRQLALEELSNRMERALAGKWESLTAAELEQAAIAPRVLDELPAASIKATVDEEAEPVTGKRIRLEISWESSGGRAAPLSLTAWRYLEPKESP